MEDEHADRVYVPGTNAAPPPARDVEPFWAPDELEAPVHGGPVPPRRRRPGPTLAGPAPCAGPASTGSTAPATG